MDGPSEVVVNQYAAGCSEIWGALDSQGYSLSLLTSIRELKDLLAERHPCAVLIALAPGAEHDGLQLTYAVRTCNRHLPIILVVENSTEELAIAALKAGASEYLRYPI